MSGFGWCSAVNKNFVVSTKTRKYPTLYAENYTEINSIIFPLLSGPATAHQHRPPSTNTMAQKVNLTDPDFEGYLTKQSAWLKEWRKRYFVLKENQLHFCKQKGVDPHGTVDLQQCLTVKSAEEKTGKR